MTFVDRFINISNKVQNYTIVKSIRDGLVNMIPVLIIGAFALVFQYFPVPAYQDFLKGNGKFLFDFFEFIRAATFGVMSVYMTFSIARSFMRYKAGESVNHFGGIIASILVFFILSGAYLPGFGLDNMGAKSMPTAIISGLGASGLYLFFYNLLSKKSRTVLTIGADRDFNRMLATLFPVLLTAVSFALATFLTIQAANAILLYGFNDEVGVDSFRDLYIKLLNSLFSVGENGFFKGFFFVLFSSILWFFGVHGSDALEGVAQTYFVPGLQANMDAVAVGNSANVILTKEFFDCFVLMGGCGSAICLLITILIFSRNKARRGLGITAAAPMIFNINELMVFGLPIIFNPIMLIPFLLTPLVCYSVSYLALATGMVPLITHNVEWTTPVILGGFISTGSIAGSILQVINIAIGVFIYLPFVKVLDKESDKALKENYDKFVTYYQNNERELQNVRLSELKSVYGIIAKDLMADIRHDLTKNITIYYQPQYNYENKCTGVEALLRWKHPHLGIIYPPLVIKLASECNLIQTLEKAVVNQVLNDREALLKKYGENIHISINATGSSLASGELLELFKDINKNNPFMGKNICVELTEQEAFSINDQTRDTLNEFKKMGILLAIDDFSMGQTTLHYLKENIFDIIKIDGSLVKALSTSQNVREIVGSLVELADSLSLLVIAEYVENEEEKQILHEMGCNCYQGFLYSPAVPLVDIVNQNTKD